MAPSSKHKDRNPPWIVRVAWLVRWGIQQQTTDSVWTLNPVTIAWDWIWSTAVEFVKQVNHSLIHEHKCLVVIVYQFYWDRILAYFYLPTHPAGHIVSRCSFGRSPLDVAMLFPENNRGSQRYYIQLLFIWFLRDCVTSWIIDRKYGHSLGVFSSGIEAVTTSLLVPPTDVLAMI